jgi:hypothetical protein
MMIWITSPTAPITPASVMLFKLRACGGTLNRI